MSSDDEIYDYEEVAPHRPAVRSGRVRICLAGRSRLCVQTGYAAKLIRAIVEANDANYESWFYFEGQNDVYTAFVDKVKHELNEEQRARYSKRSGWRSPFIWFEYPDGRRDAKGGVEKLRKWAKATFDDKGKGEHINALTARSPSRLWDLFYDITPGSVSPDGPEGGTAYSRIFATGVFLLLAATDVHFRGGFADNSEDEDSEENIIIDAIAGVMYKRVNTDITAEQLKFWLACSSVACFALSTALWWFYWIPLPTDADAKEASREAGAELEAETRRRVRNAIRMNERLKELHHKQLIGKVVDGDPTLQGNPRRRATMLNQETLAFKETQRAARKKRQEERAAAEAVRAAKAEREM